MDRQSNFFLSAALCLFVAAIFLPFLEAFSISEKVSFRNYQYGFSALVLLFYFLKKPKQLFDLNLSRYQLAVFFAAVASLFIGTTLLYFASVKLNGIDFSIFDWMLYNTYNGRFMYSPIYDVNHLGVHPSWIVFLLLPFHYVFSSPLFLVLLGPLLVFLSVLVLYKIAKFQKLTDIDALLICLSFSTTPFVATVMNNGFRIECFIPLALLSFIYFWQKKSTLGIIVAALLFLAIKEDLALYMASFSCAGLFFSGRKRLCFSLILISIALLSFNLLWAQPYFLSDKTLRPTYLNFWAHYGSDKKEILISLLTSPLILTKDLVSSGWWKLYGILLFLPLFHRTFLIASLPGILILGSASSYKAMHQYGHYYPLVLVIFSFAALISLYNHLPRFYSKKLWRLLVFVFPLFHEGWFNINKPDFTTLNALKEAKSYLERSHSDKVICSQTIAFPHLGYQLELKPLDSKCLKRRDSIGLLVLDKDPYPYKKDQLLSWLDKAKDHTQERLKEFGSVKLIIPQPSASDH